MARGLTEQRLQLVLQPAPVVQSGERIQHAEIAKLFPFTVEIRQHPAGEFITAAQHQVMQPQANQRQRDGE